MNQKPYYFQHEYFQIHELCFISEKDVNRTDRTHPFFEGENNANLCLLNDILMTYVMYNFDLGYVQGMSDLLSPILILLSNEVDAFWCFVGLMDRVVSKSLNHSFCEGSKNYVYKNDLIFYLIYILGPEFKRVFERKADLPVQPEQICLIISYKKHLFTYL